MPGCLLCKQLKICCIWVLMMSFLLEYNDNLFSFMLALLRNGCIIIVLTLGTRLLCQHNFEHNGLLKALNIMPE